MKELTFKKNEIVNVVSMLKLHNAMIDKKDDFGFSLTGNNSTAKDIIESFISDADDKHKDELRSVLIFDDLDDDRDIDEIFIYFDSEFIADHYKFEYKIYDDGTITIGIIEEYTEITVE